MYYVLFVFAMLTPVLMAVVGLIWRIHPPKRDGGFLAYRTTLSSKTEETWAFAHRHISKLWLRIGLLLSILSAVLMVVFRESASSFVLWLIGGQMVFLCLRVTGEIVIFSAALPPAAPESSSQDHP